MKINQKSNIPVQFANQIYGAGKNQKFFNPSPITHLPRRKAGHPSPNSGQTMLEVLVALTLIILFLSGVIVIQLISIRNVEFAQNKSLATKLARQQLDRAKVVRDTSGFDALVTQCLLTKCYIKNNNGELIIIGITPTGTFGQSLQLSTSDCPPLPSLTPQPTLYKATAVVRWGKAIVTPAPEVEMSTCITNWK